MRIVLLFYLLCSVPYLSLAQWVMVREIPMKASWITVDKLGAVYVIQDDFSVVKYTAGGDSLTSYKSRHSGSATQIDVTNPLNVVLFYQSFAQIVFLDKQLVPKQTIDLKTLGIIDPVAIAVATDGQLWVFDRFRAALKKIDEYAVNIVETRELLPEFESIPHPVEMIERQGRIFLIDTVRGVFVFDRYGTFLQNWPISNLRSLQIFDGWLIYRQGDSLVRWSPERVREEKVALPVMKTPVRQVVVFNEFLFVRTDDHLHIFVHQPED